MIQFPEGLPLPLQDGYGLDMAVDPASRTPLESGQMISRRRFSNVPFDAPVTFDMNDSEAQIFMAWFKYTLKDGVLAFETPMKTPLGLETYKAQFKTSYTGPQLVNVSRWRFQATLRLIIQPIIDEEWLLYAPQFVIGSSIFDIAMNQKWPEPLDQTP